MSQGSSAYNSGVKRTRGLPLIDCPRCGRDQLRLLQSSTADNPGKFFVKCPRNEKGKKMPKECTFFMWLEQYKQLLGDFGMLERRAGRVGLSVQAVQAERREAKHGARPAMERESRKNYQTRGSTRGGGTAAERDVLLQWGNRKHLRCVKVQRRDVEAAAKKAEAGQRCAAAQHHPTGHAHHRALRDLDDDDPRLDEIPASITDLEEQHVLEDRKMMQVEKLDECKKVVKTDLTALNTRVSVYNEYHVWIEDQNCRTFTEFNAVDIERAIHGQAPIARGGFGDVYKAIIGGTEVAVKVPRNLDLPEVKAAFEKEVDILKRVRQQNLVTLKGACTDKCTLVYEYLSRGTLEDQLCAGMCESFLWQQRVRVAIDVSSALVFLHATKPVPIAHGDLKPSNILFGEDLRAKLCDFGISRHLRVSTLSGTPGHETQKPKGSGSYMDPDFAESRMLTPQSDVYAFGIILLELVTSKGASGLRGWVSSQLASLDSFTEDKKRKLLFKCKLADVIWDADCDSRSIVLEMLNLGLQCSKTTRQERPLLESDVWPVIQGWRETIEGKH